MDSQPPATARPGTDTTTEHNRSFWARHRVTLHTSAYILSLLVAAPRWPYLLAGVPLVLVGLAIRTWASGYLLKDRTLCTAGPYAYTRNPLYAGSVFVLVGLCVIANSFPLTVVAVAALIIVYPLTVRYEETVLTQEFGDDYVEYCRRTPRLIPWRGRCMPGDSTRFTRQRAADNNAGESAGWVALLIVLLVLKAFAGAHWGFWPYGPTGEPPLTYGLWWRGF